MAGLAVTRSQVKKSIRQQKFTHKESVENLMSELFRTAESDTFWRTRLREVTAPTPMFVDRNTGKQAGVIETAHRILGEQETMAIEHFLRERELGLQHLVRAAWVVLLYKYGAEGAVIFGVDAGSRMLPFCVELSLTDDTGTVLARIKTESDQLLRHNASLEEIRLCASVPRDVPLFESVVRTSDDVGRTRGVSGQPVRRGND